MCLYVCASGLFGIPRVNRAPGAAVFRCGLARGRPARLALAHGPQDDATPKTRRTTAGNEIVYTHAASMCVQICLCVCVHSPLLGVSPSSFRCMLLKHVTGLQKSQLMPVYKEMSRPLRSLPSIAIVRQTSHSTCISMTE